MDTENADDLVVFEDVRVVRSVTQALLCRIGERNVWLPRGHISGRLWCVGDRGKLFVRRWVARDRHLLEPTGVPAPLPSPEHSRPLHLVRRKRDGSPAGEGLRAPEDESPMRLRGDSSGPDRNYLAREPHPAVPQPGARGREPQYRETMAPVVLPAQYLPKRTAGPQAEPQRRLMAAVLQAVVDDCRGGSAYRQAVGWAEGDTRRAQKAVAYVASTDRGWPFSFENLCDALGLDVRRLRDDLTAGETRP